MTVINGTYANDNLVGTTSFDSIDGGSGNDNIQGLDGDDSIDGQAGVNTLDGGGGSDTFYIKSGSRNILIGGTGFDTLGLSYIGGLDNSRSLNTSVSFNINLNNDTTWVGLPDIISSTGMEALQRFFSGSGNDVIETDATSNLNYSIYGNAGNDTLRGGARTDLLSGGDGNDILEGRDGFDVLSGGAGTNTLDGGNDDDTFSTILGATSSNRLIGGSGYDVISSWDVTTISTSITLNLNHENTWVGKQGIISSTGVEAVEQFYSGSGNDVIEADATSNTSHSIYGNAGNDTLRGGARVDLLNGGDGNDILEGRDGFDVLVGGAGTNTLDGGNGDDTFLDILGATSSNRLIGGAGYDVISSWDVTTISTSLTLNLNHENTWVGKQGIISSTGVEAVERFYSGSGSDVIEADATSNTSHSIYGNAGNDTLRGGARVDLLDGGDGNDILEGRDGFDVLVGGAGTNTLDGGNGDDTFLNILGATSSNRLIGGAGYDVISSWDVTTISASITLNLNHENTWVGKQGIISSTGVEAVERFYSGSGSDVIEADATSNTSHSIYGNAGNDTLRGGARVDLLSGGDGNDLLEGRDGFDVLSGGTGTNTLDGGNGDDTFTTILGATSSNRLIGGAGYDVISSWDVTTISASITLNLNHDNTWVGKQGIISSTGVEAVEQFYSGSGNDVIEADATSNTSHSIYGNAGNDTLRGGARVDLLSGGDGNDILEGRDGFDVLSGGAGTNTLDGGNGDDTFSTILGATSSNRLIGGAGYDVLSTWDFSNLTTNVNLNVDIETTWAGIAGVISSTGVETVETVYSGSGNDTITAAPSSRVDHTIYGNGGIDTITGGDGIDSVHGGDGNDLVIGATGDDFVYGDSGDDILDGDLTAGNAKADGNDRLDGGAGNDKLYGFGGNDDLFGGAGNDYLLSGTGIDWLDGGDGDDTYVIYDSYDVVTGDSSGYDRLQTYDTYILPTVIEEMTLIGGANINGTGNAGSNLINGNSGNNILDGAGGIDRLVGGLGNDTYIIDTLTDTITELVNQGTDTIQSSVNFSLVALGNIENITLTGTSATSATGNASDNILASNSAINVLTGGLGNDTYIVDSTTDTITELVNQGTDTIQSSVNFSLVALGNIENITLTGTNAITATGNITNNNLTGNSANNTLDGGAGIDTLVGGLGNDTYIVDSTTDTITELAAQGTDTIQSTVSFSLVALANIENITLTGTNAINATGNASDNILAGNSAINILTGGLGNDTYIVSNIGDTITELAAQGTDTIQSSVNFSIAALGNIENITLTGTNAINATGNASDNILAGNSAINILTGGLGNDTYIVSNLGDTITELAAQGTDTIQSSVTLSLVALGNIENLTLTGTNAINATGNATNNNLTGNSANNTLDGGAGADTLVGGLGNDIYVVDNISDTITELAAQGTDTIQSSITLSLATRPNIENLTLTGTNAINATGNATNNNLTGNSANNTLDGGTGADTLVGGLGNDIYIVDNISDTITELAAQGTDTIQSTVSFSLSALGNVENLTLIGNTANDITGNTANNILIGNIANNTIDAGGGNDTINSGLGKDNAIGGTGDDILVIDYSNITNSYGISYYQFADNGVNGYSGSYYNGYATWFTDNEVNFSGIERFNLTGTVNDDNLIGGKNSDILKGNAGDDYIISGGGNDTIDGGIGIDGLDLNLADRTVNLTIDLTTGNFTTAGVIVTNIEGFAQLTTGSGNDSIVAGIYNDTIDAGAGNDTVNSSDGNDTITAGTGDDLIKAGAGNDAINAGAGNDTINSGLDKDNVIGGTGDDILVIDYSNITSSYGIGYNIVDNGANGYSGVYYNGYASWFTDNEVNFSEIERFNLTGTANDDYLLGGKNNDILQGGGGSDILTGGNGNDIYRFNANNDLGIDTINEDLIGGIDTLDFSSTSTIINLNLSQTTEQIVTANLNLVIPVISIENIISGSGSDILVGNSLANEIQGGAGSDQISGGTGNDRFIYQGAPITATNTINVLLGKDTISDFTSGQDKLVLSKTTFAAITNTGTTLTSFISVDNDTLAATQTASIVFSKSSGKVFYNQDGVTSNFGIGGELLTLTGITNLSVNDFSIIA